MNQLQQVPTEVLDQIVFFTAHSKRDVINFSSCCKTIREELLESNPLVISLKVASDIRKLGNVNCKRMKALKKNQGFKKPNQEELQVKKRKFDEYENEEQRKKKKEEIGEISKITKAFNLSSYFETDDSEEYQFEKWLTGMVEYNINSSREVTELKTNSITMTDGIKSLRKGLLRDFLLFESGEEVCEVISKCVYHRVEYTSWNREEQEYPRKYTYKGEFNIENDKFSFASREDDLGFARWYLYLNGSSLISSDDNGILNVSTKNFNTLKLNIFRENLEKIGDTVFVTVLLSLVEFNYSETITELVGLQFK